MPPKMKGKKGYLAERLLIKPALFSTFFFFFSLGGNPISFLLLASPIFSKMLRLSQDKSTVNRAFKLKDGEIIPLAGYQVLDV